MHGSFGSYSSMSIGSAPMNITTSVISRDESCAYPSWPRRSSLSSSESDASYEPRASPYLSDDDLFLYYEPNSGTDSNDSRSASSAGSVLPPMLGLIFAKPVLQALTEAEIPEMQRQRLNMRKDLIRMVQQEMKHRRQASRDRRSSNEKQRS